MSTEQAKQFFQPYQTQLRSVVNEAWDDWRKNPMAPQLQHRRVRATCVWNQFIARARRTFGDAANVRVTTLREWEGLLFHDRVFVRFKKASAQLLSRNYPTPLALDFHDSDKDLFGTGIKRVELVYVLDKSETEIERICLVQRHGQRIAWHLDLLGGDDKQQTVLPFAPEAPSGPPVAKRVLKAKRSKDGRRKRELGGGT
ncbi:hypothetical protein FN976_24425 [Caenimonas sedimenti]|uniref:Uncharacterized protein n=1 Tax=Caenimonas sedimenti TaxID=2596921 RepID=A0A562ZIE7_9BURK|nr:hypothetical protein [Caenimonas sedimenti]TWO68085.1 hypothetical protein FN976_24425 [Caenimonas sedimenti]